MIDGPSRNRSIERGCSAARFGTCQNVRRCGLCRSAAKAPPASAAGRRVPSHRTCASRVHPVGISHTS